MAEPIKQSPEPVLGQSSGAAVAQPRYITGSYQGDPCVMDTARPIREVVARCGVREHARHIAAALNAGETADATEPLRERYRIWRCPDCGVQPGNRKQPMACRERGHRSPERVTVVLGEHVQRARAALVGLRRVCGEATEGDDPFAIATIEEFASHADMSLIRAVRGVD